MKWWWELLTFKQSIPSIFQFQFRDTVVMGFQCQHVRLFLERVVPENIHTPKSPTPFPRMFFGFGPFHPLWISSYASYFPLKIQFHFWDPTVPWNFKSLSLGWVWIFSGITKINSQIHNHNWQWMASFMIKTCILIWLKFLLYIIWRFLLWLCSSRKW